MHRTILLIALVATIAGCGLNWDPPEFASDEETSIGQDTSSPTTSLAITIIDVGQGDATLLQASDGSAALIDTGPAVFGPQAIHELLRAEHITELSWILITHHHADHEGGLCELLLGQDGQAGTADDIIIPGGIYERDRPTAVPAPSVAEECGAATAWDLKTTSPGEHLHLGDADLEVVASGGKDLRGATHDTHTQETDAGDENALSTVLILRSTGFSMVFPGDLTGGGGTPPYDTPDLETPLAPLIGNIDILHVAHHGSDTSTHATWLASLNPEVAIISVGTDNDYGHPAPELLERLHEHQVTVFQTEPSPQPSENEGRITGTIRIEVDPEGRYRVISSTDQGSE